MNSPEQISALGEKHCRILAENLASRGFRTAVCADATEAAQLVLSEGSAAHTIGFGGSVTLKQLSLDKLFAEAGKKVFDHGTCPPEEKAATRLAELTCDLFLTSANAVTLAGEIVNIDGRGNRVAASIFGPKEIVFVIGRNKIVDGDVAEAIRRAKTTACPANAMRLNTKTPCAATGRCVDCNSPERICRVTVVHDHCPIGANVLVVLVNEDLGY